MGGMLSGLWGWIYYDLWERCARRGRGEPAVYWPAGGGSTVCIQRRNAPLASRAHEIRPGRGVRPPSDAKASGPILPASVLVYALADRYLAPVEWLALGATNRAHYHVLRTGWGLRAFSNHVRGLVGVEGRACRYLQGPEWVVVMCGARMSESYANRVCRGEPIVSLFDSQICVTRDGKRIMSTDFWALLGDAISADMSPLERMGTETRWKRGYAMRALSYIAHLTQVRTVRLLSGPNVRYWMCLKCARLNPWFAAARHISNAIWEPHERTRVDACRCLD